MKDKCFRDEKHLKNGFVSPGLLLCKQMTWRRLQYLSQHSDLYSKHWCWAEFMPSVDSSEHHQVSEQPSVSDHQKKWRSPQPQVPVADQRFPLNWFTITSDADVSSVADLSSFLTSAPCPTNDFSDVTPLANRAVLKGGETGSHYKQLLYNLSSCVHVKTFFLEVERYIHVS